MCFPSPRALEKVVCLSVCLSVRAPSCLRPGRAAGPGMSPPPRVRVSVSVSLAAGTAEGTARPAEGAEGVPGCAHCLPLPDNKHTRPEAPGCAGLQGPGTPRWLWGHTRPRQAAPRPCAVVRPQNERGKAAERAGPAPRSCRKPVGGVFGVGFLEFFSFNVPFGSGWVVPPAEGAGMRPSARLFVCGRDASLP